MVTLEMLAAKRAFQFIHETGFHHSSFERDFEIVIYSLWHGDMSFSSVGHLIKDIVSVFGFNLLLLKTEN